MAAGSEGEGEGVKRVSAEKKREREREVFHSYASHARFFSCSLVLPPLPLLYTPATQAIILPFGAKVMLMAALLISLLQSCIQIIYEIIVDY